MVLMLALPVQLILCLPGDLSTVRAARAIERQMDRLRMKVADPAPPDISQPKVVVFSVRQDQSLALKSMEIILHANVFLVS